MASPIEMLVEVIAVTGPSALTDVVVAPLFVEDAVAVAVELLCPFDVAFAEVFEDVPLAPELTITDDPFDPFDPPTPFAPDVLEERFLMRRSTSPMHRIVTLSPRAKSPLMNPRASGTRHVR